MRKFIRITLLCIIVITFIIIILYSRTYTVKNEEKEIEDNLIKFINRPSSSVVENIDIKQELNIDNKKYVEYLVDDFYLGVAELTMGINNKYKIETTRYGDNSFRHEVITTNKGKYLILTGKNGNAEIAHIEVLLEYNEYMFDIPKQKYFIVYCTVPKETNQTFLDIDKIKFYDKNDIDITDAMFKLYLK